MPDESIQQTTVGESSGITSI